MNPTEYWKTVPRTEISDSFQVVISNGARHSKYSGVAVAEFVLLIKFCDAPLNIGICTLEMIKNAVKTLWIL